MLKRYLISIVLLIGLILGVSLPDAGCDLITGAAPSKKLAVIVKPVHDDPAGDIIFENVTVSEGILDRDYDYFASAPIKHAKGDPAFLISGSIRNKADRGWWIALSAISTDDKSETGPRTLDTGPIVGVARKYIDAKSSVNFTLHLSWSGKASLFMVQSQKSAIMPP